MTQEAHSEPQHLASRDRQREETRRRVFEASLEIFRRDGVGPSKIDDIVKLAGVSRGTFYFHFPTKEDVLIELYRAAEKRLTAALETMSPEAPLTEVLDTVCRVIAQDWETDPKLFPEVGVVALRYEADRLGTAHRDPLRVELASHFQRGIERGELSAFLPAELLSDFFLANIFAAALAWCGNPLMPLDATLQGVAQFFMRGAAAG